MSPKQTLRQLIGAAHLTQAAAAEVLGVSHRMLQYWLSDSSPHEPPPMALDALRWYVATEPKPYLVPVVCDGARRGRVCRRRG